MRILQSKQNTPTQEQAWLEWMESRDWKCADGWFCQCRNDGKGHDYASGCASYVERADPKLGIA